MGFQIVPFEPDLLAFFEVDWNEVLLQYAKGSLSLVSCFSNLLELGCDVGGFCLFIG